MINKYKKAIILLENGDSFLANSFASDGENVGEIVFNTGMTGYQEILTDPSYDYQIMTFTYPMIGNYGINSADFESKKIFLKGIIVREYSDYYSNFRAEKSLKDFLIENNVIGLCNVDTRKITKIIRNYGAMKAIISTINFDKDYLLEKLKNSDALVGQNLIKNVSTKTSYVFENNKNIKKNKKIIVFDFGVKQNILKKLENLGFFIEVVPFDTSAKDILMKNPDGIFLSNGPGDPNVLKNVINEIKLLIGKKPIFGICLGHQLLNLAFGGSVYKLKFGHRGINHPVKNLLTKKIEITSQNHGFAVDKNSIDEKEAFITHINLYDNTIEGIKYKNYPIFSVQYHPESAPGPHDSDYLFNNFKEMIENA